MTRKSDEPRFALDLKAGKMIPLISIGKPDLDELVATVNARGLLLAEILPVLERASMSNAAGQGHATTAGELAEKIKSLIGPDGLLPVSEPTS